MKGSQAAVITWNCRSINNNKDELKKFLSDSASLPHVICLQEINLKPSASLSLPSYNVVRRDKLGDQGRGGVATLVLSSIPYKEMQLNTNLEIIKIIITINKHKYAIINCYNPPGHTITCQYLTSLATHKNTIICGDFNAHNVPWQSGHTDREIEQFLDDSNYVLTNDNTPTRYDPHYSDSNLDLMVVSPGIATRCDTRVHDDTLGSDHCPVILVCNSTPCTLTANTHLDSHVFPRWRTSKADWSEA
jgi:exonuclease III